MKGSDDNRQSDSILHSPLGESQYNSRQATGAIKYKILIREQFDFEKNYLPGVGWMNMMKCLIHARISTLHYLLLANTTHFLVFLPGSVLPGS